MFAFCIVGCGMWEIDLQNPPKKGLLQFAFGLLNAGCKNEKHGLKKRKT